MKHIPNMKGTPMKLNRAFGILAASTAIMSFASSAFALDGADVLAKLNAVYALQGGKVEAASTAVDGTTVTMTGVTLTLPGAGTPPLNLGDVTLENVEESDEGYSIETASFADFNKTNDGVTVTIADMSVGGIFVPKALEAGTIDSMMMIESGSVGAITAKQGDKTVVSIEGIEATMTRAEDDSKFDFDAKVSGINVDMTAAPDPKAQEAITALGLQALKGEVTMKGAWTLADGKFELSEYAFDFENVGRLDINFSLSGYTLAFIKSMQDAIKASESNPDKAAGQQALGMSMMGLAQQLSYNGAQIRFDDAGITAKALEFAGKQQGVDGKQMADSLKAMMPMMLGQMNMPDLQKQIESAASTYLDDPKSITLSAKPAEPLSAPQIMGAAMANPADLVKTLNVQVTAND